MATEGNGELESGKSKRQFLGQLMKLCVASGLDNTVVAMLGSLSLNIFRDKRACLQLTLKWFPKNGMCVCARLQLCASMCTCVCLCVLCVRVLSVCTCVMCVCEGGQVAVS